jgi:peptidoglycan hydrolase-like protein with peptidoglycan-binding domain
MAGEPEIQKGISGEWVQYLQRLLAWKGMWSGGEDGEFNDALEDTVMAYQTKVGITADGVVRKDTWERLIEPDPAQFPTVPASDSKAADVGTPEQASFQIHGLPSFRYNLPTIPIAHAAFDTGAAYVEMTLSLRGNVTISFEDPIKGASLDQTGLRVEATKALGPLTEGIRVNGLGSDKPSLGLTMGAESDQTEVRLTPPNTITFIGQIRVGYKVDTGAGTVQVQGQPGYELKVATTPHPPVQPAEPWYDSVADWVSDHAEVIVGVGAVVLITTVAIAAAPETGGGSLLLLEAE